MLMLFFMLFFMILLSFFLSFNRFLKCLMMLENFNVLLLLFCLMVSVEESHMLFMVLMVVSTVEVIVGLVVLTRVWECSSVVELASF